MKKYILKIDTINENEFKKVYNTSFQPREFSKKNK